MSKGLKLFKKKFLEIVEKSKENGLIDYSWDYMILTISKREGYISINGSELKHKADTGYSEWLNNLAEAAYSEFVQRATEQAMNEGHSSISLPYGDENKVLYININKVITVEGFNFVNINEIEVEASHKNVMEVIEFLVTEQLNAKEDTGRWFFKKYSEKSYAGKLYDLISMHSAVAVPFITERRVFKDTRCGSDILVIDGNEFKRKTLVTLLIESDVVPFDLTEDRKKYLDHVENHVDQNGDSMSLRTRHDIDEITKERGIFGPRMRKNKHLTFTPVR